MKSLIRASLLAGMAAVAVAPLAQAQTAYDGYVAPRILNGVPDLSGAWSNVTLTSLQRPAQYGERLVMTEEEVAQRQNEALELVEAGNAPTDPNQGAEDTSIRNCSGPGGRDCGYNAGWKDSTTTVMRVGGEPRTGFIISTADGRLPERVGGGQARGRGAAPQSAADRAAASQRAASESGGEDGPAGPPSRTDNPESMGLGDRCLISFGNNAGPPMLPNGYYNNNIKLVQGTDSVAILVEMIHDVRIVRLNEEHRNDGIQPFFGDSIGWYEGDTLVVETVGFEPRTSVQGANSPTTKVTERFTRVAPDRLHYRFTVEDPTVWTEPWTGEYEFQGGVGEVYEYACHEGNYGLENMMAGARFEEQEAAAGGEPVAAR